MEREIFESDVFFEKIDICTMKITKFVEICGKIYQIDEVSEFLNGKLSDVGIFVYDKSKSNLSSEVW